MVAFGFCIDMVPINGWDTNNVWHLYGWGRHPHARNDHIKRIMWSKLYNTRADHVQLMIHRGCLKKRLNTILIWRTATLDPWNSHGMLYLHNWWPTKSGTVHNRGDLLTESHCAASITNLYRSTAGASKHYLQCNPEITRDMNLFGSHNRLTNVLESGDNRGLQSNNARTNTLYKSQWCYDVAEVKHVRHNHLERH